MFAAGCSTSARRNKAAAKPAAPDIGQPLDGDDALARDGRLAQPLPHAEHENGRQRDDGSHQHGRCPYPAQALSIAKCGRHLAAKPSLPHPQVGRFDICGQFRRIEQCTGVAIFLQFLPQRDQALRIACQGQRRPFIFFERCRDQFRQADRRQQAARDTARKGVAAAGQNRQSRPQRVAGRGVGVAGQGVEKQVGMPVTREMLGRRYASARRSAVPDRRRDVSASERRLPLTSSLASSSHKTLPGTARSSRIQISKNAGEIL